MTLILFLFLSFSAFAQQQFEFRLEGTFRSDSDLAASPATINYSMVWNEAGTTIQGIYRDNYFTQGIPNTVSGEISEDGRVFNVIFPDEVDGVKSIILSTPRVGPLTGSIQMEIETQDRVGGLVHSETSTGLMRMMAATFDPPFAEDDACTVGFGALTNYCGIYGGRFVEIFDPANRCNLPMGTNPAMELNFDTIFRIYPDYLPGVPNQDVQVMGAFVPSPMTNSVNVTGRNCGVLDGTNFIPNNCKVLNLTGSFLEQAPTIIFTGTYSISDTVTGETCSYTLDLRRQSPP